MAGRRVARIPSEATIPRANARLLAALVVAAAVVTHARVLSCDFVGFDDPYHVTENPFLRKGLTLASAGWALTTDRSGNWFPLTWLTHAADVSLYGLAPAGHHATSLLLHAANALLLFAFWRRATGDDARSALVALLFAVHPMNVESVAWVSERKGVLSMAFGLGALLAWARYAREGSRAAYATAIAAHAASLASKPTFVSLPILLLLLDVWPFRRAPDRERPADTRSWRTLVAEKLPFVALSLISSGITLFAQRGAMSKASDVGLATRTVNVVIGYAQHLRLFAWPSGLSVLHPYDLAPPIAMGAGALLGLAAVTGWALRQRRARPWIPVGWLWWLVALVPMIGVVQVGQQAFAERYAYLPAIGLTVALVWTVPAPGRVGAPARAVALVAALLLVTLSGLSLRRIGDWRDGVTLFEAALRTDPDNVVAMRHLGIALARAGRLEEARARYEQALARNPRFRDVQHDLALVLVQLGRRADAEAALRTALALDAGAADVNATLGSLLAEEGRLEEARWNLQQALRTAPDRADVHRNLGLVLARLGRADEAEHELAAAVALDPTSSDARNLLGFAKASRGDFDGAIAELEEAVRLDPANTEARANLERARAARSRR